MEKIIDLQEVRESLARPGAHDCDSFYEAIGLEKWERDVVIENTKEATLKLIRKTLDFQANGWGNPRESQFLNVIIEEAMRPEYSSLQKVYLIWIAIEKQDQFKAGAIMKVMSESPEGKKQLLLAMFKKVMEDD